MPMPRADSTIAGSIPVRPTTALRRIGSTAKNVTTATAGATPNPSGAMSSPTSANAGSVSPIAETLLASELSGRLR